MNIALVTDRFSAGGGLEHLFQVVRAMPDVRFAIFAKGGDAAGRFSSLDNVSLFPHGYGPGPILRFCPRIVHIHHLKPLLRFCSDPFSRQRPPLVFTAHGLHVHKYEFSSARRAALLRRARLSVEKALLGRADRVIAVSREDEAFLRKKYGLTNTLWIPNGIDLSAPGLPLASRAETRRALGLPIRGKVFLTVARFDRQKGYDVLVRAITLGQERFRTGGVCFLFVGDGPEFRAIRKLAVSAGVEDRIVFAGHRSDIYCLMLASDLFILPSRWEGLAMVLLEASLCGLPIVCSDTYGNREFVQDAGRGLLFRNEDPADLCRVLTAILLRPGPESSPGLESGSVEQAVCMEKAGSVDKSGWLAKYDIAHTCARLRALYGELGAH